MDTVQYFLSPYHTEARLITVENPVKLIYSALLE
jgi:hypothetical protein